MLNLLLEIFCNAVSFNVLCALDLFHAEWYFSLVLRASYKNTQSEGDI